MTRDLPLIRRILLHIDGSDSTQVSRSSSVFDGSGSRVRDSVVDYHMRIMDQARLIDLEYPPSPPSPPGMPWTYASIAAAGGEFLELARDDRAFTEAVDLVREKTGGTSFEMVKMVLERRARGRVEDATRIW